MPSVTARGDRPWLDRLGLIFPFLVVLAVFVIVVPVPALLLDLLLAGNITIAVMVLLTAIQVRKPLEFSVFPALLLGTTLSRLVLNIASTRLILAEGATAKLEAAGGIIQAFGDFVAGGSLVIGLVLFLILIAVQFLVITSGATRISEVAARFTLDALPGKQHAIDAELNAGAITPTQAQLRRDELSQQMDFYGAMDGASKFVRGDALAGIVITLVNVIGGLYIGLVEHGMSFGEASRVFTTLTIGDGLVSQVPAFLIALAAGFLVTRTSSESDLSRDAAGQLLRYPTALFVSGGALVCLSFTGLPMGPMLTLGGGCLFLGFLLQGATQNEPATPTEREQSGPSTATHKKPDLLDRLQVEPLELVLGIGLLKFTRPESGNLLARLTQFRQEIAGELGLVVPSVRVRDELILERNEYRIRMKGVEIARGTAFPDGYLALETSDVTESIPGIAMASLMPRAKWIEDRQAGVARDAGYRVVDPVTALMIHFGEVVREHAADLLTRQQVYDLLERLKRVAPRTVEELVPERVSPVLIHQVLSKLLSERVPIRDLESILHVLGERSQQADTPEELTEHVRGELRGAICEQYRDAGRTLSAIAIAEALENELIERVADRRREFNRIVESLIKTELSRLCETVIAQGKIPVVLCDARIRSAFKRCCDESLPRLAVLSRNELSRETRVEIVAELQPRELRPMERIAA